MGPTKAIIQHQHLIHNFNLIRQAVGSTKIMGVVKADAYGHGSLEVAQTLIKAGAEYLGVAFLEEGIELREHGIQIPILVFGAHLTKYFENHLQYGLDITLTSLEQLPHLEEICQRMSKKARVHIKVDTGMGRVGFRYEEFTNHLDTLFNVPFIDVIGVYTHFASADENDLSYTELQLQRLKVIKKVAEQYGCVLFSRVHLSFTQRRGNHRISIHFTISFSSYFFPEDRIQVMIVEASIQYENLYDDQQIKF